MTMKPYSPERKAAVITRMLPPQNQSVNQIARQEAPPKDPLPLAFFGRYYRTGVVFRGKSPREWSPGERFTVIIETAPLSAHAVVEYCRCKGLYPDQIQ
nr:hypothetical protein [Serratia grimesii]